VQGAYRGLVFFLKWSEDKRTGPHKHHTSHEANGKDRQTPQMRAELVLRQQVG